MKYPTDQEIERADRMQLGIWCRFLPIPTNEHEKKLSERIFRRFLIAGGWNAKLCKRIGWIRRENYFYSLCYNSGNATLK